VGNRGGVPVHAVAVPFKPSVQPPEVLEPTGLLPFHPHPRAGLNARRYLDLDCRPVRTLQPADSALVCLGQGNGHGLLDIAPASCARLSLRGLCPEQVREEVRERGAFAKQVLQVFGRVPCVPALLLSGLVPAPVEVTRLPGLLGALPVGAELVVLSPLLLVREDLVGLVDLLELAFGLCPTIRVDIRVMLPRQLPIRDLYRFLVCVLGYAEDLVVVFVFHAHFCSLSSTSTPPVAAGWMNPTMVPCAP